MKAVYNDDTSTIELDRDEWGMLKYALISTKVEEEDNLRRFSDCFGEAALAGISQRVDRLVAMIEAMS